MMSLFSSFDLSFFLYPVLATPTINFGLMCTTYLTHSSKVVSNLFLSKISSVFVSNVSANFKFLQLMVLSAFQTTLLLNIISMYPFVCCPLSQVSVVASVGFSMFLCVALICVLNTPQAYSYHMVPEGSPIPLSWVVFLIELVSISIRPITISVRIIANSMTGHVLLSLLCSLVSLHPTLFPSYLLLCLAEVLVCLVQSYIFATMVSIYFNDVG